MPNSFGRQLEERLYYVCWMFTNIKYPYGLAGNVCWSVFFFFVCCTVNDINAKHPKNHKVNRQSANEKMSARNDDMQSKIEFELANEK